MSMIPIRFPLNLTLVTVACAGCSSEPGPASPPAAQSKKPKVFDGNDPLAFFAESFGRGSVDVVFPVPDGLDPAYWDPDGEAIAAFQSADMFFLTVPITRNGHCVRHCRGPVRYLRNAELRYHVNVPL
jgi:ABC-type Zn uptake system ZnuABC Zn-binding protein ZnuA